MIHVRMCDQNGIDGGKIFDTDAGMSLSAQQNKIARKDWVDQKAFACQLDQEGGMADKCDAECILRDSDRALRNALYRMTMRSSNNIPKLEQFACNRWMGARHILLDEINRQKDARAAYGFEKSIP